MLLLFADVVAVVVVVSLVVGLVYLDERYLAMIDWVVSSLLGVITSVSLLLYFDKYLDANVDEEVDDESIGSSARYFDEYLEVVESVSVVVGSSYFERYLDDDVVVGFAVDAVAVDFFVGVRYR